MRRSRKKSQLDASWKYKDNLKRAGIPLRDDLARAAFVRVLDKLADRLEKNDEEALEKGINIFIKALPKHFDKEKAHSRMRKLVGDHWSDRQAAKSATDSSV